LSELLTGEEKTKQFINRLMELNLLTPVSLDITFVDERTQRVEGMYTIDEDKMAALPAKDLVDLHQSGYLPSIYTMTQSLAQIYSLINRKNQQISKGAQWFAAGNM